MRFVLLVPIVLLILNGTFVAIRTLVAIGPFVAIGI